MTLIGKPVVVELKNDLIMSGTLVSVDQFLNLKLDKIKVQDEAKYPHMMAAVDVDTALLQDAARKEAHQPSSSR